MRAAVASSSTFFSASWTRKSSMAFSTMRSMMGGRQVLEVDHGVEAVAELRGEGAIDGLGEGRVGHGAVAEADEALAHVAGSRVAGHDEDDVAEIGLAALVVGEGRVVHDLQEDVVDVGMGLLDLVEEDHGVGRLADGVGEEAALLVAHVAGRRAYEARDRMLLLVLGHVEAVQGYRPCAGRAAWRARSCRRPWGRRT